MKKLLFLTVGLLMCGCSDRNEVTTYSNAPIKLDNGLYVKEYCLGTNSFSSTRYVFVQCDAEGNVIRGLSCASRVGKTMTGTTVVSGVDSSEEDTYRNLIEKYGANSDFGLYLKLRDKYESK